MFKKNILLFLSITSSLAMAVVPGSAPKNQVAEYKKLGFSLALIRDIDKRGEKRFARKNPRHAKYIAAESKKKDALLSRWVGGEIKRLKAQKELEENCRKAMDAQFRR